MWKAAKIKVKAQAISSKIRQNSVRNAMSSNIFGPQRCESPKKALEIRKIEFTEVYESNNAVDAQQQASRCLSCGSPFCEWKCPLHNPISKWLKLAAEDKIIEAAELSHHTNSLPEICGRVCPQEKLCELACVLHDTTGSVTIGHIERYINDTAFAMGWRPNLSHISSVNKRVAIIGAGPAGLSCADVLIRNGVNVVVFDKHPEIGGLLTFGIPSFKLEKKLMVQRREIFTEMGIQFQLNTEVGTDVSLNELLSNYDAIFIGTGTYQAIRGNLPKKAIQGVFEALPYLIANTRHLMQLSNPNGEPYINLHAKRVIVLGGGDTAMDCVRTAIRQGAKQVSCFYRRDEQSMPASRKEVANALDEGAQFHFNMQVTEFVITKQQQLMGVYAARTQNGELENGRYQVELIKDSTFFIEADAIIVAYGFIPHNQIWLDKPLIQRDKYGHIIANRNSPFPYQTSHEKVFAGGDTIRGSDLVVTAIADGRNAAEGILLFLGV
ncbi:glutamate synthase small subunit [Providencia rettgeri]|uniref:Glutamate synthase small subunit n=2 Tax=Providencia rettgeri TaxID=587 RepID=A0A264VU14_PRORE|nr:glutamate synthase small subunit [Providencia rettgeri]